MRADCCRARERSARLAPWLRAGVLLATLLATPTSALAYCRLTTTMAVAGVTCTMNGNPLYWPDQCIQYSVTEREAASPSYADIRAVVDESFMTWLDVDCGGKPLPMSVIQTDEPSVCSKPQYNDEKPNVNSIIFVQDWAERDLPAEAFGLTLVWHRKQSGIIVDADMQLNETLGTLGICGNRCERGIVDMQNIITHEAGHFLGLGHSTELDACMYGKATVGETSKRLLNSDDAEGICAVYGSRAEPACMTKDYLPDNGQGQECYVAPYERSCGCAVPGNPTERSTAGILGLLAVSALLVLRRRRRQRFTA